MDGRHRTPWPVRPRSSLPSVAWWKGQGNCFDASRATLENVDHAATLHYPGSPPARYRLTPSSPPPITGTGPGTYPRRPRASCGFSVLPGLSSPASCRSGAALLCGRRRHIAIRRCRSPRPCTESCPALRPSSRTAPRPAPTALMSASTACHSATPSAFHKEKKSPAQAGLGVLRQNRCRQKAIRSSGAGRSGTTCRSPPRAPRPPGRNSA